ncbi:MAG: hypothetical protein COB53_09305 [Elusimicrobia bacterium]|nr:MAG: hypothetical protein COB53_09305 [Elusimicrobiota bacterium]
MTPRHLLAALLIGLGSAAQAGSDPNWDGAVLRKGQVSGDVRAERTYSRKSRLRTQKSHPEKGFRRSTIPAPAAAPFIPPGEFRPARKSKKTASRSIGRTLGVIGASSIGVGLFFLIPKAKRPVRFTRLRHRYLLPPPGDEFRPPTMGPLPESSVPPKYVTPPPADLKYVSPWWAITMHEQRAIDRWSESPERELGIHSLEAWLDAHAETLLQVDVELLKKKISRSV